jgi:hypothetical protein
MGTFGKYQNTSRWRGAYLGSEGLAYTAQTELHICGTYEICYIRDNEHVNHSGAQ